MSSPVNKPCIFCGGRYIKTTLPKEMEVGFEMSTLVIGKLNTPNVIMGKSVIYHCATCGNIQAFLEKEPKI